MSIKSCHPVLYATLFCRPRNNKNKVHFTWKFLPLSLEIAISFLDSTLKCLIFLFSFARVGQINLPCEPKIKTEISFAPLTAHRCFHSASLLILWISEKLRDVGVIVVLICLNPSPRCLCRIYLPHVRECRAVVGVHLGDDAIYQDPASFMNSFSIFPQKRSTSTSLRTCSSFYTLHLTLIPPSSARVSICHTDFPWRLCRNAGWLRQEVMSLSSLVGLIAGR